MKKINTFLNIYKINNKTELRKKKINKKMNSKKRCTTLK